MNLVTNRCLNVEETGPCFVCGSLCLWCHCTRQACVTPVSAASQTSHFLLIVGKEQTTMAEPCGWLGSKHQLTKLAEPGGANNNMKQKNPCVEQRLVHRVDSELGWPVSSFGSLCRRSRRQHCFCLSSECIVFFSWLHQAAFPKLQ